VPVTGGSKGRRTAETEPDASTRTSTVYNDPRPAWSKEPFHRFLDYLTTEMRLVHLAADGIHQLVKMEGLAAAIYGVNVLETPQDEVDRHLALTRERAELAREEVEADFPLLHAHSLMGAWGALEALIEDVVRTWLTHNRRLMETGDFAAVKVPLGEFQRMKIADRIDYLIDQVPRPHGVGGGFPRFEALLGKVGLGGPVDEELRRRLIEAHQARNIYAHRGGTVDRKARAACPWRRDWKLGRPLQIGHEDWSKYVGGIRDYGSCLVVRAGAVFGVDALAHAEEVQRLTAEGKVTFDKTGVLIETVGPDSEPSGEPDA
jgi:hypothetical protein